MTNLPKSILVAVDFGPASARAVAIAGELAARTGASLRLLHAESLDVPPYFTPAQLRTLEGEERANSKRAADYLATFGRRLTSQAFTVAVESRTAVDAILQSSPPADLVVMGTHGRRGPSRWWLGSVAERVLRETQVPVLVVHMGGDATAPQHVFAAGLVLVGKAGTSARTRHLADAIAARMTGTIAEVADDDVPAAHARTGATWAAIPMPIPQTAAWRAHVGEPLLQSCAIPLLFVPEADGGPAR